MTFLTFEQWRERLADEIFLADEFDESWGLYCDCGFCDHLLAGCDYFCSANIHLFEKWFDVLEKLSIELYHKHIIKDFEDLDSCLGNPSTTSLIAHGFKAKIKDTGEVFICS